MASETNKQLQAIAKRSDENMVRPDPMNSRREYDRRAVPGQQKDDAATKSRDEMMSTGGWGEGTAGARAYREGAPISKKAK